MGLLNPLNSVLLIIVLAAIVYGIYKLIKKFRGKNKKRA